MPQSSVLETIHAQSDSADKNVKPQSRKHPNTKRTGELAEAAFVVKAASLGYAVSKPWGDSERYDFILDSGPRTWRVQIKCTESLNANGYQVQSTYTDQKKKGHYTTADIDVLVAYILPLNLWYVVPARAFPASASLRFYPEGNISGRPPRFEQYREAWHLFQHPQSSDCHPVSNDAGACQGFLFDTQPWTHWVLTQRHFALVEKVLTSQTKVVTLCNLAVGPQVPPSISSVLAPMILSSNSPLLGEAGCPLKRSVSLARPQNDSGSPA